MKSDSFDVIVVGIGGMGAATCRSLAARGVQVLGLERFSIPHEMGSSHGESRIFRIGYYEHPNYVPLLQEARKQWLQLEDESGKTLFHQIGGLWIGPRESTLIAGTLDSALRHNLQHELFDHTELQHRFPQFSLSTTQQLTGFFEADAGLIEPEESVTALTQLAWSSGAVIKENEVVIDWTVSNTGVFVTTDTNTYHAEKLVLTAGAWMNALWKLDFPVTVTRQPTAWFSINDIEAFRPRSLPCWGFVRDESAFYYGFPTLHGRKTVKISLHHSGTACSPESVDRTVSAVEIAELKAFADRTFPGKVGRVAKSKVCLYTNTSDVHFMIDHHPLHPDHVIIGGGFSGHGFKFVPLIGDILANLVCEGETRYPVEFLGFNRLGEFKD